MAVNNIGNCVTTVVEMYENECLVTVNGTVLNFDDHNAVFESSGVTVALSLYNRVLVSVPNCGLENVVMIMSCKTIRSNGFVEFQVEDGFGIQPFAHGLVGKDNV